MMPAMTMIEAIRDAHCGGDGARRPRRRVRRGRRLLRRRVPLHAGAAGAVRQAPLLRRPDQRVGHRRRRDRDGGVRPAAVRRDPVRRLHVSRLRPDRVRSRAPPLPLRRRLHGAARRADADRRWHLRRPDAQPEPGGAVHPRGGPQDGRGLEPVRRQGTVDRRDRGRRPGDLPRTEAALQRTVRRSPRPADRAVVAASARRGARRATTRSSSASPACTAREAT